jgi:filamentous hemagglutinin
VQAEDAGKPTYEPNPKHGSRDRQTAKGTASAAPTNGQAALDTAVQVKPTSPRRVGVDSAAKEIVVFDEHMPGRFHGHVRRWRELHPDMRKALLEAGLVTKGGKVK